MYFLRNIIWAWKLGKRFASANSETGKEQQQARVLTESMCQEILGETYNSNDRLFRKMRWYMMENVWMSQMFADLLGCAFPEKQKHAAIYSAGIFAISDYLIDDLKYNTQELHEHVKRGNVILNDPWVDLMDKFMDKCYGELPASHLELVTQRILELHQAQLDSSYQLEQNVNHEKLIEITREKCAVNALLCLALVTPSLDPKLIQAVHQLGGFIQCCNDTQDIFKDSANDTWNFANIHSSWNVIEQHLIREFLELKSKFRELDSLTENIERFLFIMHAMLVGIRFKIVQYRRATGPQFDLSTLKSFDPHQMRLNPMTLKGVSFILPKVITYQ